MEVKNKVAVITGGLGGIGFETTRYLLKNKVKVCELTPNKVNLFTFKNFF